MIQRALWLTALLALLGGCGFTPASPTATPVRPTATPAPTPAPRLGDTQARPADGMTTVYVPTGEFLMGSSDEEVDQALHLCNEVHGDCERAWFENEQPAHTVALDALWMDRTEVTNAQFAAFLNEQAAETEETGGWVDLLLDVESDQCLIEQAGDAFQPKSGYADHPAILVSWYGAAVYCRWAEARLPTEAEWEYAARGPNRPVYPWGDAFDGTRLNYCDATCEFDTWKDERYDDGHARTAPVGSHPDGASWCGALDMAGNVWEWVADWYAEKTYSRPPYLNPQGPRSGRYRVQRGGAWTVPPRQVRSALRDRYPASWQDHAVGFRCAVSVREDPPGPSSIAAAETYR